MYEDAACPVGSAVCGGGSLVGLTYAIAILFGLQFLWSYYWNCYRKGYTMDVWHLSLLNMAFIIHFMLPFSRSDLNRISLGASLERAQDHVTQAYLISALGYAAILAGGSLWRVHMGMGLRRGFARFLELPARGPLLLLRRPGLLLIHGVIALSLIAAVLLYYFSVDGFGFNLRGLLLVIPALRPVAQFAAFYSVLIGSLCLARYTVYRERSMLIVVLLIVGGLQFYGERSNLLALTLLAVTTGLLKAGRRVRLWWLVGGAVSLLFLSMLLNAVRQPNFSLTLVLARFGLETFYGNSFSDTRDFALVLSFWDGQHFYGLTYLAGLLAFIPRALSPFRDHWAIGVVTATMAGFSPTEHPGLRPGVFGEAYLNFGLVGVVLAGVLMGSCIRFVDLRMKQALAKLPSKSLKVFSYYILFTFTAALQISSGASAAYTVTLIFLISWVLVKFANFLKLSEVGA